MNQRTLDAPLQGLALRLSSREAVLVTTQVSERVGLARPLRLTVHEAGEPAPIEQVVETTLKLTLLHHGALKAPPHANLWRGSGGWITASGNLP